MKKYANYCRALANLHEGAQLEAPYTVVEQAGIVGLFESCFEQAWKLTHKPAYARQYLAAKRLAQPEQEYVAFLAECPDLYEASLALEERMQQCEEEWQQSEGAKFISHATEAMQDGAAHICRQMLTERFGPLKEQYKGFVAR